MYLRTSRDDFGRGLKRAAAIRAREVGAAQEADFRIEGLADLEHFGIDAVAIRRPVELARDSFRCRPTRPSSRSARSSRRTRRSGRSRVPHRRRTPGCRRAGSTSAWLRLVNIAPIVLRRRMSRLTRSTVKFVPGLLDTASSPVWMFITPTPKAPTLPVSRPPASIGTTRPRLRPIRLAVEQIRRVRAAAGGEIRAAARRRRARNRTARGPRGRTRASPAGTG